MAQVKRLSEIIEIKQITNEFIDDTFAQHLYTHFNKEVNKILKRKSHEYSFQMQTKDDNHFVGTVIRYFAKSKEFYDSKIIVNEPSLHKGLLILGDVGIGKSLIMMAMSKCNAVLGYAKNNFQETTCKNIVRKYDSEGQKEIEKFMDNSWYFDDIGTELPGSHFGKKIEVMQLILEERCHLFNRTGIKTHLSSNYDLNEFKARYGVRVHDRLFEMFNIVVYKRAKSFRT